MTRSDALTALVAEVVDLERTLTAARADGEFTKQEFVVARQALDAANERVAKVEARRKATLSALDLIAARDDVSNETVDKLLERAR